MLEAQGVGFGGPTITHEGLVKLATRFDLDARDAPPYAMTP